MYLFINNFWNKVKENRKEKNLFIIYDQRKSRLFKNFLPNLDKELDVFSYL